MSTGLDRRPLTVDGIVDAAFEILDQQGLDQLTTTNVARRLGVTQPALYRHIDGIDELRSLVALRGAAELSALIAAAVEASPTDGDEALFAAAQAYRAYVRRHPARYLVQLSTQQPAARGEAMEQAAEALRGVLRSYGLAEDRVRSTHLALRSAIHGFAHLEAHGALRPPGAAADDDFAAAIALFAAGVRALAAQR